MMKVLASRVSVQQYCHGLNEVEFTEGVNRIEGKIDEILNVSQWGMPELVQYLNDMDMMDSYLKQLNTQRQKNNPRVKPVYQLEFHHWKPIKAKWAEFTDLFLSSKIHAIVCGRAGSIYEYQKNDETGKMGSCSQ
ncbi:hypothetical protein [Xenorhabdus sp. SGI246]|uniref:hypothetical protein n=1 Tax=Xenorhabdus sp. SGI246 TaxID=3158263 RepID=UPI00349FC1BF